LPKIEANRDRDARKQRELEALGWRVLTIWQCEIGKRDDLRERIAAFVCEKNAIDTGADIG
jgi:DNA mismatch endonuclease (patch repair protein)